MKVSELFAEIGFKVDKKGLTDFSNSLKLIKQTITQSVSGLEKMAAMAERLANAANSIRFGFSASDKDLTARYRAQTTYIRAVANQLRGEGARGRGLGAYWKNRADLVYRDADRLEASLRLRQEQWEAKKAGLFGGRSSSGESIFLSNLGAIIVSSIPKGMAKGYNYVKNLFTKTLSTAMSYRDYLTFTGRNASELNNWFARSFNATDLSRQDVMSAAMGFEKGAWDIFFGKRSPAAYLKLGLFPTGNGAKDMANILTRIAEFSDRGLRASILSEFPEFASKQGSWLQVIEDIAKGNASYEEVYSLSNEEIKRAEEANRAVNAFTDALEQAKLQILDIFVNEGGLTSILKAFTSDLRNMVSIMGTDEFKNASFVDKLKMLLTASPEDFLQLPDNTTISLPKKPTSGFLSGTGYWVENWLGATADTLADWMIGSNNARTYGNIASAGAYRDRQNAYINIMVNNAEEASRAANGIISGNPTSQIEMNYTNAAMGTFLGR